MNALHESRFCSIFGSEQAWARPMNPSTCELPKEKNSAAMDDHMQMRRRQNSRYMKDLKETNDSRKVSI